MQTTSTIGSGEFPLENPSPAGAVTAAPARATPRGVWAGRVLSGLAVLFLLFDAAMKLASHPEAVAGTTSLGFPAHLVFPIGVLELALLALYLVPRTAVVGAVLWTGYLGGAIATHVRLENPLFSHVLFPVYVAVLLWGGLFLRDARVRGTLAPRA